MREYAKVSPRFWTGETGKRIRQAGADVALAALYLMSGPNATMTGIYYMPVMYLAHETGIGVEAAGRALATLIGLGFCGYDYDAEMVWVINMAKFQVAERLDPKDKRRIALIRELESCGHEEFADLFRELYLDAYGLDMPTYAPQAIRASKDELDKMLEDCGHKCQACHRLRPQEMHLCNPVARINGGRDNPSNRALVCSDCLMRRGWQARIEFWLRAGKGALARYSTPSEGVAKGLNEDQQPLRSQEQEQEQEQEHEQEQNTDTHTGAEPPGESSVGQQDSDRAPAKDPGVKELVNMGVPRQAAVDWLKNRKAKRLRLTETALAAVIHEAEKAGMTLPEAIARAAAEGWAGFKASWLSSPDRGRPSPGDLSGSDYGPGGDL